MESSKEKQKNINKTDITKQKKTNGEIIII